MIEFDKLFVDVDNDIGTLDGIAILLTKFGGNVNVGKLVVRLVGKLSIILLCVRWVCIGFERLLFKVVVRLMAGKLLAIIVIVDVSGIVGNEIFGKLTFGIELSGKLFNWFNAFGSKFVPVADETEFGSFINWVCCCTTTGVKVTAFGLDRLTGVKVTDPMVFELEVVLGMFKTFVTCAGTGVNVTDGVVALLSNEEIVDVLTIDDLIPSTVFVATMVGKAAGGGGGSWLFTIPTMSLMFLLVLFPGMTRGGG